MPRLNYYLLFGCSLLTLFSCTRDLSEGPAPALSPREEQATFRLAPGLRIELVASEPLVEEPVAMTFDREGRLWVVEMRGFMPDIDGNGEELPTGRISVLTDRDGDGQMDSSVVFLDSLVLPRALALVPGGALVAENKPLWWVQDLDGDLRADTSILVDAEYGGSGMPEHSPNGLWRGMDNWYYNAKSKYRYRFNGTGWERDETEFRGQWGICHDDEGRLFYNYNWSQLHADLVPPNYLEGNPHHHPATGIDEGVTLRRDIYPIRPNPAVNRGYIPGTLDEQGRLLEFTSAGAPLIYRGTALPTEYLGNAFVCEPAGNLIKRNIVEQDGWKLTAHYAYPDQEFLASTDERFRPVFLCNGPDGALYVADMYHGIIQHGAYITPYLREQILSRRLDRPVHLGRIWRIVGEQQSADRPAQWPAASTAGLVPLLSHANGWHRDMAQRLLVERQDRSVLPLVETLALQGDRVLGRLHALWTLEGLGQLKATILLSALDDPHSRIRATALRLLEPFARRDTTLRTLLGVRLSKELEAAAPEWALQMALSARVLHDQDRMSLLTDLIGRYCEEPLMRDAVLSSLRDLELAMLDALWRAPRWQTDDPAKSIFLELLAAAVTRKGHPQELTALLAKLGADAAGLDWRQNAVLNGMIIPDPEPGKQRARLEAEPALLTAAAASDPQLSLRLNRLTGLFDWPGNDRQSIPIQGRLHLDDQGRQLFAEGRQQYLTVCAGCHGNDGAGLKRFGPPLIQSDWVLGDEKRLSLILLHGMEGPLEVNGKLYDVPDILPVMPSHSVLSDRALAAILTYIRNEWGHSAGPVLPRTVGHIRHRSQGQVQPWKASELLNVQAD